MARSPKRCPVFFGQRYSTTTPSPSVPPGVRLTARACCTSSPADTLSRHPPQAATPTTLSGKAALVFRLSSDWCVCTAPFRPVPPFQPTFRLPPPPPLPLPLQEKGHGKAGREEAGQGAGGGVGRGQARAVSGDVSATRLQEGTRGGFRSPPRLAAAACTSYVTLLSNGGAGGRPAEVKLAPSRAPVSLGQNPKTPAQSKQRFQGPFDRHGGRSSRVDERLPLFMLGGCA